MINLIDTELQIAIQDILQKKLTQGIIKRELVNVFGLRGVGKTYGLVNFAKNTGLSVVLFNKNLADKYIKECNYEKVYGKEELSRIGDDYIIIDEGTVDYVTLVREGYKVVTGYYNSYK